MWVWVKGGGGWEGVVRMPCSVCPIGIDQRRYLSYRVHLKTTLYYYTQSVFMTHVLVSLLQDDVCYVVIPSKVNKRHYNPLVEVVGR